MTIRWWLLLTALAVVSVSASAEDSFRTWNFDADLPGTLTKDFAVGTLLDGRPAGEWKIIETDRAKSGTHVLAQLMGKGAEHAYKIVTAGNTESSDLDFQASFLPVEGKADMGGGVTWRMTDDRNYYLTRANPLEQNIRIYRVVKGIRHMLENYDHIIDVKKWHTLRVIARGCQVQVLFDEQKVFDLCDQTFTHGRIGLWTKSDAVTYFDDLRLVITH